jgi:hypothetical protein
MNVFLFTEELMAQSKKKLRAAGADLSMVHYPHPEFRDAILRMAAENSNGEDEESDDSDLELLLPAGSDLIVEMIREASAELVIWDPISNYVDADKVNTNSDPAVRRALEPLVRGLDSMNAAGIMVRHMNKDARAAARHRGSDTTVFENVGSVHLVMVRLGDEFEDSGMFGLSMVANNYTVVVRGTLAFDVVDSDVKLDSLGHYVGKVEWHDLEEEIDADALVRGNTNADGSTRKPGPTPVKRTAVRRILRDMGEIRQLWDAVEGMAHVREEMEKLGFDDVNRKTVDQARGEELVTSQARPGTTGAKDWHWPAQKVPRVRN